MAVLISYITFSTSRVRVEDKRPFHLLENQLQFTMKPVKVSLHNIHQFLRYQIHQVAKSQHSLDNPAGRQNPTLRYHKPLKQKSIPRAQSLMECFDASKLNRHTNFVHQNASISVTSPSTQTGTMQPWSRQQPPLDVNTSRSDPLHLSQEESSNRLPHALTNL